MKISALRKILCLILDEIDRGNCDLSEEEIDDCCESLSQFLNPNRPLSKTQAAKYLNMSTRQFDRYISVGLIPKGQKQVGFTELSWRKKDLDKSIKKSKCPAK